MARLLYFAALADRLGMTAEDVELPANITTARELLAWLRARGRTWEQALDDHAVQVTVNRQMVNLDSPLPPVAEIGLFAIRQH